MILEKLSILNYKNIIQAEMVFSPGINCFFGNNGMGKTNLLDAIYYLSFCKSHLHTPDSRLIRNEQDLCVLQGAYLYDSRREEIFCSVRHRQRKVFKRNKKEYDKLSEHIGLLPLVMVSPVDSDLIRGGSEERRRFIDLIISQQDKSYLHALIQYSKALFQRNVLLKTEGVVPDADGIFSIGGVSIGFQKTGLVNGFGRGEHPGFHGLSGRSRAQRLKTAVFDLRSRRLDVVKRDPDLIQIFHSLRPGILPLEFQFQDPVGFRHDRKLELLVGLAEIPIGGHRERTGILAHPERIAALGGECNFNGNGGSSVDLEVSRGAFHSKESGRGEQEQVKFLHDSVLSEWFVVNEFYNGLH